MNGNDLMSNEERAELKAELEMAASKMPKVISDVLGDLNIEVPGIDYEALNQQLKAELKPVTKVVRWVAWRAALGMLVASVATFVAVIAFVSGLVWAVTAVLQGMGVL